MKIRILLFAVLILLSIARIANAEEPTFPDLTITKPDHSSIPQGALVVPLLHKQPAPFPGILWNDEASAWLMAEFEAVQRVLIAESNLRLSLVRIWANHEILTLKTSHNADKEYYELRIASLLKDIDDLKEINDDLMKHVGFSKREKMIVVLSTVGTGLVAGLIGYGVGKAK